VPGGRQPRASIWALSTPLVVAAAHLGLLPRTEPGLEAVLEGTAQRLQSLAERCRPDSDAVVNPAKSLALAMEHTLPVIWGSSALAGVAAYRFASQLAENAKRPAVHGTLPEAQHNGVMALGEPRPGDVEDLFRDRVEEPSGPPPPRLVLLRDAPGAEHPRVARRAEASKAMLDERGAVVQEIVAEGESGLERLAELVGLTDYASVYLAILAGVDPTPVEAIEDLKRRIAD
jgi:glucose/mannose-6-phosphate isomerase